MDRNPPDYRPEGFDPIPLENRGRFPVVRLRAAPVPEFARAKRSEAVAAPDFYFTSFYNSNTTLTRRRRVQTCACTLATFAVTIGRWCICFPASCVRGV